jgi:Tfp pilus assembly protein PilF
LSAARNAERLDPFSVVPWYLMASAHETQGQLRLARSDLAKALELEPDNFATMGIIGDFYARRGQYAQARQWYARALEHNPVDVGLQQLAETGGKPAAS